MDHLKTTEERQDRWYSKLWPRYIPVVESKDWQEALAPQETYECALSIPMEWLTPSNTDDRLQSVLKQHGFVVISGVLTEPECREALSLAWDYLEAASVAEYTYHSEAEVVPQHHPPLQRNEDLTYCHMPRSVEGGMLPYYGSGHSTFAWFVRSHHNVRKVFASLHGTDDLVSSLDGIVLWLKENQTDAGWFHMDQHPIHKPDQCGIQGLVNLLRVTQGTGGNVLVAHSHKHFPHHYMNNTTCFYKERMMEVGTDDWLEVDPNDEVVLQPQHVISCLLQPGDLLLWDSRTVHCSYPGNPNVELPRMWPEAHGLIRAGVLVSMIPDQVSSSVLNQRVEAVHQGRTLTHWANKTAPLGEERSEEVAKEASCVTCMRAWQSQQGKQVLLSYNKLTIEQQHLVDGKRVLLQQDAVT